MTKEEALSRVASMMAHQRMEHIEAASKMPQLSENTSDALQSLNDMATALGIIKIYEEKQSFFEPRF